MRNTSLNEIRSKYDALIKIVKDNNMSHDNLIRKGLHGAFHTDEGGVVFFYDIGAAYASDTILVWANRIWKKARHYDRNELEALKNDRIIGWLGHPIPCDIFLDLCSELICQSIEIGLPLRGAISMGHAHIEPNDGIFLGIPIIDASRLEHSQNIIGATPHISFHEQPILPHYLLPYRSHLKDKVGAKVKTRDMTAGAILDWPRRWRMTRKGDPRDVIHGLKNNEFSVYYDNTINLINFSEENQEYWHKPRDLLVYG